MKMSEAIYDMHAYTRLTDYVFHQILLSTEPELEEVGQISEVFFWRYSLLLLLYSPV